MDFFVCVCRYVVCMCLHMCVSATLCVYMERPEDSAGLLSFSIAGAHGLAGESLGSTSVPLLF